MTIYIDSTFSLPPPPTSHISYLYFNLLTFCLFNFNTDGVPPESAQRLVDSLKDYASDFRVSKSHLSKLKFSVFGLGGSYYSADFCRAAKDIHGG